MKKYYSLIDKIYSKQNILNAFKLVKKNKGAPGIDGETVFDFEALLDDKINEIHCELKSGEYKPSPVKRTYIDKDDGTKRPLGIPTVKDRVVQQAVRNIIEPIFEKTFHPSSYGYRPNRSCQMAVAKAESFANHWGLQYVVDMDFSKCFDTLNHDMIIDSVNEKISDGKVLKLIRNFLESGILDGFIIKEKYISIHPKRIKKFKEKVRKLTPRNSGYNVEYLVYRLNQVIRGWCNYFRIANCKRVFENLMKWIHRRLRMKQMKEWKSYKSLHKTLRRRGYKGAFKKISMTRWRNSLSPLVCMAVPNKWFDDIKLFDMSKVETAVLHYYKE